MTRLRHILQDLRDNAEWYAYWLTCIVVPALLLVASLLWRVTRGPL